MENMNVTIIEISANDGRWDDAEWVNNQASISAMCEAIENGREIG